MASNTENLNLLMKNPSTDGADTFNVDTMLNENWRKIDANAGSVAKTLANILKPTTPPLIGLPPSTTPDGMFQALGNTGELHVWRKTVVTGTAKVELEPAVSGYIVSNNGSSYNQTIKYSSAIDEKGNLSGTITTLTVAYNTSNSDLFVLKGKYFEAGTTEISSNLKSPGGVWYIPNDASIQYITGQPNTTGYPYYYTHVATKMQKVVYVPAGTTTTYPVSTNPNAYQEGDDAKEAGYTLGEVVTGKFAVSFYNAAEGYYYKVSGNIDVSSSGFVSMPSTSENVLIDYSHNNNTTAVKNKFAGKFVQFLYRNGGDGRKFPDTKPPFNGYDIVYIPDNVSVTQEKVISNNDFVVDRYQPVTGYAAIPAGTTIEYLGKLGDKARVQVVSYVGTGTYGKDNPCSISVDFPMKAIVFLARVYTNESDKKISTYFVSSSYANDVSSVLVEQVPTTYSQSLGLGNNYYSNNFGKRSKDRKSYYWYNTNNESDQGNFAGTIYYFLVIG